MSLSTQWTADDEPEVNLTLERFYQDTLAGGRVSMIKVMVRDCDAEIELVMPVAELSDLLKLSGLPLMSKQNLDTYRALLDVFDQVRK